MTSRTSAIAVDIASDKSADQPAALGGRSARAAIASRAHGRRRGRRPPTRSAIRCVVKPLDGNHGRGVALDLRIDDDVRKAFQPAYDESRGGDVVVETFVNGNDYRVADRRRQAGGLRAARSRRASLATASTPSASWSTSRTRDPRRGIGHEKVLTRIKVTPRPRSWSRKQGFDWTPCRPRATRVSSRRRATCPPAAPSIDRTHRGAPGEHRDRRDRRAGGRPGRRRHRLHRARHRRAGARAGWRHRRGQCRARASACTPTRPRASRSTSPSRSSTCSSPPGSNARIPIIGVTGTNGKTTTVRMIGHILKLMGRRVGMTTTDGIVIDGRLSGRATCPARSRRRWCSRTRPSTRPCSRSRAAASCARAWATTATTSPS